MVGARQPSPGVIPGSRARKTYFTLFSLTENPISESGAWSAAGLGLDRTDIRQPALPASSTPVVTASGVAHGVSAATSASGFDDGRARLSGFTKDHSVAATMAVGTLSGSFTEVEVHLRFDDSGTYARGYEVYISGYGQYFNVVRWNGDGSYTYLYQYGAFTAPSNGDIFYAEIKGNLITAKINGVTFFTMDITAASGATLPFTTGATTMSGSGAALVFNTGQPGIGFY